MSLFLVPTLPQLPFNYFWCSRGVPRGLMKTSTGLLTSTLVITTKVPKAQLLCPAPQGSETRAWHVADAEGAIRMLILPDYFCTWASGTCSISAWLPFPSQPFLQNENKNRNKIKQGLWAAGVKASQLGYGLLSLCL